MKFARFNVQYGVEPGESMRVSWKGAEPVERVGREARPAGAEIRRQLCLTLTLA